jgi:hypothetical protein
VLALNLVFQQSQPAAGLIMHSLGLQLALLLATGFYAGVDPPEDYQWVWVPEGYTEEEVRSSRFQRVTKRPSVLTDKTSD